MRVYKTLRLVSETTSTNEKKRILQGEKGNKLLQQLLKWVLDPYLTFGVTSSAVLAGGGLPLMSPPKSSAGELIEFFDILGRLSVRALTGYDAIYTLRQFFDGASSLARRWLPRVLDKDLRIGANRAIVNSVWPGLVPCFGVQLANLLKPETRILTYPLLVDAKIDGLRLVAIKQEGVVRLYTRRGHEVDTLPSIVEELEDADYDNLVLDGEILNKDWNSTQSLVASTKNEVDDTDAVFNVFDAIPIGDWEDGETSPLRDRLRRLRKTVMEMNTPRVELIPSIIAQDWGQVEAFYEKVLRQGYEGAMIKDLSAPYAFKRSDAVLKVKPREKYTGVVVGAERGVGKYEDILGRLFVDFGGVQTRVGSGFTDEDRRRIWQDVDSVLGRRVEVFAQGKTKDGALRFPVFVGFRSNKD